jgi:predicted heme/steroid binding protein
MTKSKVISLVALVVIVLVGALAFMLTSETDTNIDSSSNSQSESTESAPDSSQPLNDPVNNQTKVYTQEEVALHDKESDCWTIINGSVYDITTYVPRHPGGDEILLACGTDSTTLFTNRTNADGTEVGSGTPHSSSANNQLERLKIGSLE